MKLKLDLHTHPFEVPYVPLSKVSGDGILKDVVATVKAKGLDGIAITEHRDKEYGFKAREIISQYFDNEIMIIPGCEIDFSGLQLIELYLPDNVTFRFIPHPVYSSYFQSFDFSRIHGIEIENYMYDKFIDKQKVKALAEKYDLLLLSNSDAHNLADIGRYYNIIELDDLSLRAKYS